MTEKQTVFERVQRVISECAAVDLDKVKPETVLDSELGLDSLDLVELIMELEEAFNVKITDEQAEKCETVKEAAELIEELL